MASNNPRYIPKKMRTAVMERDNHQCTRCSCSDELIIHHILPVSEGGISEMDNLQVLCMACHKAVHIERGDEYAEQMASTRNGWRSRKKDYAYKQKLEFHINQKAIREDFGLSDAEIVALGKLCSFVGKYPTLPNLANRSIWTELKYAILLQSLLDKDLITVSSCDGRSAFYRPNKTKMLKYYGLKVGYYDDDDNEKYVIATGDYWRTDGSLGIDLLAVGNEGGRGTWSAVCDETDELLRSGKFILVECYVDDGKRYA